MKIRKSVISLVAAAILFTACGGGGGSSSSSGGSDTTLPTFTSPSSYNVIAGTRKAIKLTLSKPIIDNRYVYKFNVVEKPASIELTNDQRGVITYTVPEVPENLTIKVTVQATNTDGNLVGSPSEPFSITFKPVSLPTEVIKPLPVVKDVAAYHKNGQYNVVGPRLIWEDSNKVKPADILTYQAAVNYCEDRGWRVPALSELLGLIDYSKATDNEPRIPDVFTKKMTGGIWAEKENGRYIQFSESKGTFNYADESQNFAVRCVKGEKESEHVIYSDPNIDYTYDATTKLEWAPFQEPGTECTTFQSEHLDANGNPTPHGDYRVPTINELLSVMSNGDLPYTFSQGKSPFLSSTDYLDENGTKHGVYMIQLDPTANDKYTIAGYGKLDDRKVFCVRDMN
jgi:hypothetical protein